MKTIVRNTLLQQYHSMEMNRVTWTTWIQTKFGHVLSADRTLAFYLWGTCRGLIICLALTSIIPGRLHGWTGRLLRFPILGMVYVLIGVELLLYIFIRFLIRALEGIFANSKHRSMRIHMAHAQSYKEWYDIASSLDISQDRYKWTQLINDDTAYRYSWPFILELLNDLQSSREKKDVLMALAVLQQCTRKNVGGIMSEDMFSYTNAGEPKVVVGEFVEEVVRTLRWVTDVVKKSGGSRGGGAVDAKSSNGSSNTDPVTQKEAEVVEQVLQSKRQEEQSKLYASLMEWATLNILNTKQQQQQNQSNDGGDDNHAASTPTKSPSTNPLPMSLPHQQILRTKIKTFLKRARAAYGRTALCLSGGAMMGNYHFGAVRALLETGLLPHIISGTSAGSVIGAMLCTRTDEELLKELQPEILADKMVRLH